MSQLNSISIIGRIVNNANLNYTNGKTAVSSFTIANNESRKKNDEWVNYANFFDCIIWGKYGEAMQKHLTKGKEVAISGRLHQERWQDSSGNTNSRIRIVVENIDLLRDPHGPKDQTKKQAGENKPDSDDIPFFKE